MDSYTFISKFTIRNRPIYLKLYWKNNDTDLLSLTLFDGENSWTGRYSHEFAQRYMQRVGESKEEYHTNVKKALSGKSDKFTFDFSSIPSDTVSATFSWKKKYEGEKGTIPHGSVPVHQDDNPESKDILIDYLLHENSELRQCIKEYTRRNEALSTDLEECKQKLEKFIDIKTSLETSLYGKFVQLLNTKKKRIQLLEENLQRYEDETICNELD